MQRLWDLQNHAGATLQYQWHIAAELYRVSKTLLGMEENCLTSDLVRSAPQRLGKTLCVFQLLGFPSPFVLFPAAIEVADEQPAERLINVRRGKIRPQLDRAVVARQRILEPLQLLQGVAPIEVRLGIVGAKRQDLIEARQRLLKTVQRA